MNGDSAEEAERNLLIAHLLLEYGADPVIAPDPNDSDLFSEVWYDICEKDCGIEMWNYQCRFFLLLVAYGGKKDWIIPKILDNFDRKKHATIRLNSCRKSMRIIMML